MKRQLPCADWSAVAAPFTLFNLNFPKCLAALALFVGLFSQTPLAGQACSGTPNAGTSAATVNPACQGSQTQVFSVGADSQDDLLYQWQESTDGGGSYTNIPAATGTSIIFIPQDLEDMNFRCVVTCPASGQVAMSVPVDITPYLPPDYFYADDDGDTFGNPNNSVQACSVPAGYVTNSGDCNDSNASVFPGAPEICGNNLDDNCNGQTDEDNTSPTITCPANATIPASPGLCTAVWIPVEYPNVSDNCSGTVTTSNDCFTGNPFSGTLATTWTATDASGNTATCIQLVTVIDVEAPVLSSCPANISATACGTAVSWNSPFASDNCGVPTLASNFPSGTVFPSGTSTVLYTAVDASGNNSTCSFIVEVPYEVEFFIDLDGDTYGNPANSQLACSAPSGYVSDNSDCNDANANVHPGAADFCNGLDDNCNGQIDENTVTVSSFTKTIPNCFGSADGTIRANPSSGTGPYTYLWNNGANTRTATGLVAGTYTVTVTNAFGCTATGTATLNQPTLLSAGMTKVNPLCFGGANGTATASSSGGTSPKTYAWSSGTTTATATGLTAGTYTVTVTDARGCTATASGTLTNPTQMTLTMSSVSPNCYGDATGKITVTVAGGTNPKTYFWNFGGTTATITGLSAGTYTVTATDAKGCTASMAATLVNPPVLQIVSIASAPSGSLYKVTVTAAGGTGTKKYRRSTGALTWSAQQSSNVFLNVASGNYTFQVLDSKLCVASLSQIIPVPVSKPDGNPTAGQLDFGENAARPLAFDLAPNPTSESVHLRFSENDVPQAEITVLDALGRTVLHLKINPQTEGGDVLLPTEKLPDGAYQIVVWLADGRRAAKTLVVAKG